MRTGWKVCSLQIVWVKSCFQAVDQFDKAFGAKCLTTAAEVGVNGVIHILALACLCQAIAICAMDQGLDRGDGICLAALGHPLAHIQATGGTQAQIA